MPHLSKQIYRQTQHRLLNFCCLLSYDRSGLYRLERGVLGSTAENLSCPICLCRRSSIMRRLPRHARKQNSSGFIKPTPRCFCARMPTTSGSQESISRKNSTATQGAAEREPFDQSGGWGEFPQQAAGEISGDGNLPVRQVYINAGIACQV